MKVQGDRVDRVTTDLEAKLNDLDPAQRLEALAELARRAKLADAPPPAATDLVNMHCHSLYSYNAYGYSPPALAWLAWQRGWRAVGLVDFDVLDGVDEFFDACDLLGVRGAAALETRTFLPEFADREINSPGEPGVLYHMGIGFASSHAPAAAHAALADLRARAAHRNRDMVARLNRYLDPVTVDYDADVLSMTPSGNATERHMLVAYFHAAEAKTPDPVAYWADRLDLSRDKVAAMMENPAQFQNTLRARLMKRGGVAYEQPGPDTFPPFAEVQRLILTCGALPCYAFLDGTSPGEQALGELLDLLVGQGTEAVNIIPDRNWNIADPTTKAIKLQRLYDLAQLADDLALPLNIGTEMNSPGQRLVDDIDAVELEPLRQAFLDGASFVYGHTVLQRALGLGYNSDWALGYLPDRRARNAFYTHVGRAVPPGRAGLAQLQTLNPQMSPSDLLARLSL